MASTSILELLFPLGLIIPLVIMILGPFSIIGLLFLGRFRVLGKRRRSPFTADFLRAPGQSLEREIDDLRLDLMGYSALAALLPLSLLTTVLGGAHFDARPPTPGVWLIAILLGIASLVWLGWRAFRAGRKLRSMLLGLEGEVAVGQELNQLLAHGFRVYHDFPADDFNIDHIVIGPTGVFAVETKPRPKPDTGNGKQDARVEFDGKRLMFPGWTETRPLEQAQNQAR